jgi:hypothetical protein
MNIKNCWVCGSQPQRTKRMLFTAEWVRFECCTAGSSSPHQDNAITTWNEVQDALALMKAMHVLHIDADQFVAAAERTRRSE